MITGALEEEFAWALEETWQAYLMNKFKVKCKAP